MSTTTSPELLSGNSRVDYFDSNNRHLGHRDQYSCGYSTGKTSHSAYWPNTAYFCPECGDIWAREIFTHKFNYQPLVTNRYVVESRPCADHGDGQLLVGKPLEGVSHAILLRELTLITLRKQK